MENLNEVMKVPITITELEQRIEKLEQQMEAMRSKIARTDLFSNGWMLDLELTQEDYDSRLFEGSTTDFFFIQLSRQLQLGKIQFETISKNIHWKALEVEDSFDIVMYGEKCLALIFCIIEGNRPIDWEKFTVTKVNNFRSLTRYYKDYTIYIGIAGFEFTATTEQTAREKGVAIVTQNGDVLNVDADYLKAY